MITSYLKAENSATSSSSNAKTPSKFESREKLVKKRPSIRRASSSKEVHRSTSQSGKDDISLGDYHPIKAEGSKTKPVDISQLNTTNSQEKEAIEAMSLKKWKQNLLENLSVISDVLLGQYLLKLECTACQTATFNFEPFHMIDLVIPPESDELKLTDLLTYSCKPELLDNFLWNCPKCKKERQVIKTKFIYKLPPILIICFKRFDGNQKNTCLIKTNLQGENMSQFEKGGDSSKSKMYIPYMFIVRFTKPASPWRSKRRPLQLHVFRQSRLDGHRRLIHQDP